MKTSFLLIAHLLIKSVVMLKMSLTIHLQDSLYSGIRAFDSHRAHAYCRLADITVGNMTPNISLK